jgi:GT2 family glycosyltransferase
MVIEDATESSLEVIFNNIQQPFIHQVILVDNGNSQSVQILLQRFVAQAPQTSLITENRLPQGQALAMAFSKINQPYVMILDQNHQMMENATWRLLLAAQMVTGSWVMGVQRKGQANQDLPSCTYLPTPMEALKQLFKIQSSPSLAVARTNGLQPYYVPAANSACIFMPAQVWKDSQGWDEATTIWGGYSDFCLRLHEQKGDVYYLPEVTVTEMSPRVRRWQHQLQSAWGLICYFNRHYTETSRLIRWPLALALGAVCVATPWINLLKSRWHARTVPA